jgi:hypothetical protein
VNVQKLSNSTMLRVAAIALVAFAGGIAQPAAAEAERWGLTGSWLVEIQQYDCATQAPLGTPFDSFLTFGEDRTLIESTNNPGFEPGQRGPGHGFWESTGHGAFRAVSEAFILFDSPARGPIPPFATGRQRIEQAIDYAGGDRFTSEALVYFTDPSGTVLRSGCARASASRITD